jgi:SnoaL-like protein
MKRFKPNLTRGLTLGCVTLAAAAVVLIARAADTPSTVSTLADRAEIEDLLVDYYGGFSGDHKGFASFYVEDGILDVNGIVAQGKDAINKLYSHSPTGPTRKPGVFRMLLTNIRISVNGATAKADAIWTGIQDENVKAAPEFIEQGREHDELVKQDGHWLLKHRWITADAGLPAMYEKTYKPRNP